MKIYEHAELPNPRLVRIFLAEKGLTEKVEFSPINVFKGEHKTAEFKRKNPLSGVPVLELDNGTCIAETVSICRYFEALYPEKPLLGESPEEKGLIDMWQRRIESSVFGALGTFFHHATPGLGDKDRYRNKEWGEKNLENFIKNLDWINFELSQKPYIAGKNFSLADITLLCAIDFGLFAKVIDLNDYTFINQWYKSVSEKPSTKA